MRPKSDRLLPARLLGLLLVPILVLAACGTDDDSADDAAPDTTEDDGAAQEGGSVIYASDQEPTGWNINTASDSLFALQVLTLNVYPQPFRVTPEFEVELDEQLMVSAEQTSDDPQVIEYVIQPDAVWDDDTPITADDFIYYYEETINPDNDVASTTGYDRIESVEGSGDDNKTVTVTYAEVFPDWQGLFGNLLPAHIMAELEGGWNDGLDAANIPEFSGGPMRLEEYQLEQSVALVPNEAYWGDNGMELDEIIVRFGITADALSAAFENDEIDVAYPQPQIDLTAQIDAQDELNTEVSFGLTFEHIDFNLDNEFLSEFGVRQAIALCLDREELVQLTVGAFSDEAQVLNNRIWLDPQPEYEAHGDDYQERDVEAGIAALEEAGFEEGEVNLRITTTGGNALREQTQEIIQSQLAECGINIEIANVEGAAAFELFFPETPFPEGYPDRNFDIALFAWVGTPFTISSTESLYIPEGGQNAMNYNNPEIAELFAEANSTTDRDEGVELTQRVDITMWEDLPTIPLYTKPTYLISRGNINNVIDNASTAGPLWNAFEWSLNE